MSLNFGFNVGVRSGHHRHPNTVEALELLQECIRFFLGHSVFNTVSRCILLRMKMFQTVVAEKIKTHILCSVTFSPTIVPFVR